jgi:hypothetical protein
MYKYLHLLQYLYLQKGMHMQLTVGGGNNVMKKVNLFIFKACCDTLFQHAIKYLCNYFKNRVSAAL